MECRSRVVDRVMTAPDVLNATTSIVRNIFNCISFAIETN